MGKMGKIQIFLIDEHPSRKTVLQRLAESAHHRHMVCSARPIIFKQKHRLGIG